MTPEWRARIAAYLRLSFDRWQHDRAAATLIDGEYGVPARNRTGEDRALKCEQGVIERGETVIAQTVSDVAPCSRDHLELARRVREGIRDEGGRVRAACTRSLLAWLR